MNTERLNPMVKVTISKKIYSDIPSNKQRKFKHTEYHIFYCERIHEVGVMGDRRVSMKLYCANNEHYKCYAKKDFLTDSNIDVENHGGIYEYHPDVHISISPKHYILESIEVGCPIKENK